MAVTGVNACIRAERITIPLFTYGTLCDPEIRIALFGSEVEWCEGELRDHRLLSKDGFFLVAGEDGSSVRGSVLFLSGAQLAIADLWEEVPLYTRKVMSAILRGREGLAWVYSRPGDGAVAAKEGGCCDIARERVLEMARSLSGAVGRGERTCLL